MILLFTIAKKKLEQLPKQANKSKNVKGREIKQFL